MSLSVSFINVNGFCLFFFVVSWLDEVIYDVKHGVIRNDCRGFNNFSYTINSREQYMCFLFNRTTLQVFVPYLTGVLYVHPLWFYKHQDDNEM